MESRSLLLLLPSVVRAHKEVEVLQEVEKFGFEICSVQFRHLIPSEVKLVSSRHLKNKDVYSHFVSAVSTGCSFVAVVSVPGSEAVKCLNQFASNRLPNILSPCETGRAKYDAFLTSPSDWAALNEVDSFFPFAGEGSMERTLVLVKPDISGSKGIIRDIKHRLNSAGLQILLEETIMLSKPQAEQLFKNHQNKPFFSDAVKFMSSLEVIVMILEGPGAVNRCRILCGPSDPAVARNLAPQSLRAKYGADKLRSAVHTARSSKEVNRICESLLPHAVIQMERAVLVVGPNEIQYEQEICTKLAENRFEIVASSAAQISPCSLGLLFEHCEERPTELKDFKSSLVYLVSRSNAVQLLKDFIGTYTAKNIFNPDASICGKGILYSSKSELSAQYQIWDFFPWLPSGPIVSEDIIKEYINEIRVDGSLPSRTNRLKSSGSDENEPELLLDFLNRGLGCVLKEGGEGIKARLANWLENNKPLVSSTPPTSLTLGLQPLVEVRKVECPFASLPTTIFVLGGPASGKGTQCRKLAREFNYLHISIGELFRLEISNGTTIGKEVSAITKRGDLVDDGTTLDLIKENMQKYQKINRFLFDGFPRTLQQEQVFWKFLPSRKFLIYLDCDEKTMTQRVLSRGREDDTEEAVSRRLELEGQTKGIVDLYQSIGAAIRVDSSKGVEETFSELKGYMSPTIKYFLSPWRLAFSSDFLSSTSIAFVNADLLQAEHQKSLKPYAGPRSVVDTGTLLIKQIYRLQRRGYKSFAVAGFPKTLADRVKFEQQLRWGVSAFIFEGGDSSESIGVDYQRLIDSFTPHYSLEKIDCSECADPNDIDCFSSWTQSRLQFLLRVKTIIVAEGSKKEEILKFFAKSCPCVICLDLTAFIQKFTTFAFTQLNMEERIKKLMNLLGEHSRVAHRPSDILLLSRIPPDIDISLLAVHLRVILYINSDDQASQPLSNTLDYFSQKNQLLNGADIDLTNIQRHVLPPLVLVFGEDNSLLENVAHFADELGIQTLPDIEKMAMSVLGGADILAAKGIKEIRVFFSRGGGGLSYFSEEEIEEGEILKAIKKSESIFFKILDSFLLTSSTSPQHPIFFDISKISPTQVKKLVKEYRIHKIIKFSSPALPSGEKDENDSEDEAGTPKQNPDLNLTEIAERVERAGLEVEKMVVEVNWEDKIRKNLYQKVSAILFPPGIRKLNSYFQQIYTRISARKLNLTQQNLAEDLKLHGVGRVLLKGWPSINEADGGLDMAGYFEQVDQVLRLCSLRSLVSIELTPDAMKTICAGELPSRMEKMVERQKEMLELMKRDSRVRQKLKIFKLEGGVGVSENARSIVKMLWE